MNISKENLKQMLESAFRTGILYGYGINHENAKKDESKAWEEYLKLNKGIEELFKS